MKTDLAECASWEIGDRVVALQQVLEEGEGDVADPNAKPCTEGWVHAEKDELGTIVHVEPGYWPTVRWDRTQTATCVTNREAKLVPSERIELSTFSV